MKGSEAVAAALVGSGIDTVFSVPGDGNLHIDYALAQDPRVTYVKAVREDGAVMMADGFARATGRLAAASVTRGPGLTNAITAITSAVRHRTPMLVLTAEEARNVKHHFQSIDVAAVVGPTGAELLRVERIDRIGEDLAEAARLAWGRRLPVVAVVPMDVQTADVPGTGLAQSRVEIPLSDAAPGGTSLDTAVGVLASARRPLVLAGKGAAQSGAREEILDLARRLGAPVCTTAPVKDFFQGDEFNLGIIGSLGSEVAQEAVAAADCVLVFGASLNDKTCMFDWVASGKTVVQCDSDLAALGRYQPVTAGVVGDARAAAAAITTWLTELDLKPADGRSTELARKLAQQAEQRQRLAESTSMTMRTFLTRLDTMLPSTRNLVTDGGRFFGTATRCLSAPEPGIFLWTLGFGSIGLGLGTAIGGAFARRDTPTVVVVGDGGFMMSAPELSTAVRYGLDLITVVMNDGSYGAEYGKLVAEGMDPGITLFEWPEIARLGDALGADSIIIRNLDSDMGRLAKLIAERSGPVLIDARFDPALAMR